MVTKDLPDNVIAVGNPYKIVREITEGRAMQISDIDYGNWRCSSRYCKSSVIRLGIRNETFIC